MKTPDEIWGEILDFWGVTDKRVDLLAELEKEGMPDKPTSEIWKMFSSGEEAQRVIDKYREFVSGVSKSIYLKYKQNFKKENQII